jgi:hypothetical protein
MDLIGYLCKNQATSSTMTSSAHRTGGRSPCLKRREERGGLGRLRSGGEDRLLVGLQDGKTRDIARDPRAARR